MGSKEEFDKEELFDTINDIKKKTRSRGLGDTVHKIAKALGADKIAEKYEDMTGKDCGCEKRREALNQLLSYYKEDQNDQ